MKDGVVVARDPIGVPINNTSGTSVGVSWSTPSRDTKMAPPFRGR
ncbi:hypothetical protein [Pseudarthrobacter sp. NS4]